MPLSQSEFKAHFEKAATNYERRSGGCTRRVAEYLLTLIPPIKVGSVIHDNAAGPGVVTGEILKLTQSHHIQPPIIKATDCSEAMISVLQSLISERQWTTVTASVMDSQELKFDDESFTHSITNFGIFALPDPEKGLKEIYRSLKSGGTAAVTIWKDPGNMGLVHKIQKRIRPDLPLFVPIQPRWFEDSTLRDALMEAGFEESKIKIVEKKAPIVAKDVDDLIDNTISGSFWTAAQKGWTEEEKRKWGDVAREELTDEQRQTTSIEMIAWVAVAER